MPVRIVPVSVEREDLPHHDHFRPLEVYECKPKKILGLIHTCDANGALWFEVYYQNRAIFGGGSTSFDHLNDCRQRILEVMNEKIFTPLTLWPDE